MRYFFFAVLLSLLAFRLQADGCYFPVQAILKMPEIPAQQAIVTWKDGTETLVIASSLDSESQKLGWVIPLPSVPETIEKTTPGTLKTLSYCLQPKITHDLSHSCIGAVILAAIILLLTATALFDQGRLVERLVVLFILFFLFGSMFPAGVSSSMVTGAKLPSAAHVEKTARVGAYTISILRSGQTDGLTQWLSANGFSGLPAAAQKSASEYIREGWVFAAIALSREETGGNTPHPLKMTFKTDKPVYPMRLTAAAGGTTDLDLFVIADKRASGSMLKEIFCDQFLLSTNETSRYETATFYDGKSCDLKIGHPTLSGLMWPGCIVTKLSGAIAAKDMTEDIHLQWQPFKAYRQHLYTRGGAKCSTFLLCLWGIGGVLWASMILFCKRIRAPQGGRWLFRKIMLPATLAILLIATGRYALLSKLDIAAYHETRFRYSWYTSWMLNRIAGSVKENPGLMKGTEEEIARGILAMLEAQAKSNPHRPFMQYGNRLTGGKLFIEDSPGNFTVTREGKTVVVHVYGPDGRSERKDFY